MTANKQREQGPKFATAREGKQAKARTALQ